VKQANATCEGASAPKGSATWKQKKALNSTTSKTAPQEPDWLSDHLFRMGNREAEPHLRPSPWVAHVLGFRAFWHFCNDRNLRKTWHVWRDRGTVS